jgi:hypothetical protein
MVAAPKYPRKCKFLQDAPFLSPKRKDMKKTILIFLFIAAAAIAAAAQPEAERDRVFHDDYRDAIHAAEEKANEFSERTTYVSKYYSEKVLTKTVTHVFERLPGDRYKSLTITEENGAATKREEWVSIGRNEYYRVNNGRWKNRAPERFEISERSPGFSAVVEVKNEYFRIRAVKEGEQDVYVQENTITTDGIPEKRVYKYSILNGLITAYDSVMWEKTPDNIKWTETRKHEHGIRDIKIVRPVLIRLKKS